MNRASQDTQERFERAMSNIIDFIDGKPLKLLNPEALSD
jgi:hypothetical protein